MPRTKPEKPQETTSIILAKDLLAFFRCAAKQQDRPVTSLIRVILTEWATAHGFRPKSEEQPKKHGSRA